MTWYLKGSQVEAREAAAEAASLRARQRAEALAVVLQERGEELAQQHALRERGLQEREEDPKMEIVLDSMCLWSKRRLFHMDLRPLCLIPAVRWPSGAQPACDSAAEDDTRAPKLEE